MVQDTILPIQVPGAEALGEEVHGVEVPGEAGLEVFHRAEAELVRVPECEVEAEVVAQDGPINIQGEKDETIYQTCNFCFCRAR